MGTRRLGLEPRGLFFAFRFWFTLDLLLFFFLFFSIFQLWNRNDSYTCSPPYNLLDVTGSQLESHPSVI